MATALDVIRHAGTWMRDNGIANYSEWWDPEQVNAEMLRPYAQANEFFVVAVDGTPAAAAIIQEEQSLQDWSYIDGEAEPPHATYLHYVSVERAFAGQDLVGTILDKAMDIAQQNNSTVLRLDTNADEPKLCALYESYGFIQVGVQQEGDHLTAFYEKPVVG